MYLRPTRASRPPATHVLVYDGECPFCTATATWTQRHTHQPLDLMAYDAVEGAGFLDTLSRTELESAAHLITPEGIEYHAGEAITRSLRLVRFGRVAAVLDLPGLAFVREVGYTLIARLRPLLSKFIHP